jgi:hypothetical protein
MTEAVLRPDDRVLPLEENKYIAELLGIFKANGMKEDAKGLSEIVGCVSSMERDITKAIGELTAMRREISAMREEQSHPIRTMLSKVADGLMSRFRAALKQVLAIKEKIIGVCKKTVEDVKDKGIVAANGVVGALNIKADIESYRDSITGAITYNEEKIANIETASTEFHTAGRAIKNIGRALMGKEPIPEIKPNGKLAQLLQAPFRSEIRSLNRSLNRANNTLARLDKLEKAADLRAERDRPSIYGDMERIKSEIEQSRPTTPNLQKLKTAEESL